MTAGTTYDWLVVSGTAGVANALVVGSSLSPQTAYIYGNMDSTNITVAGSADLASATVTIASALTASTAGGVTLSGTTSITGAATLSGTATLAGAVTFGASGSATFLSATPASFLSLNASGTIAATGTGSLISGPKLSIVGNPIAPYAPPNNKAGYVVVQNSGTTTKGAYDAFGHATEYLNAITLRSNTGSALSTPENSKVAQYIETTIAEQTTPVVVGSGPAWCLNMLLFLESSLTTVTTQGSGGKWAGQGYELDVRNQSAYHFGDPNVSGSVVGLNITAGGTHRITAGAVFNGVDADLGTSALLNYGIVVQGGAINNTTFVDWSTCGWSYYAGGAHGYGFDTSGATIYGSSTTGASLRIGNYGSSNLQRISAIDPGRTIDVQLIAYNTAITNGVSTTPTGAMLLGSSSVGTGGIQTQNDLLPSANSTYFLGNSTLQWKQIWATGGVLNPSTPSLKKDIAPLPAMLPLVLQINPVSYKWKSGGFEHVQAEVADTVPAYDEYEELVPDIQVQGTIAVQTMKTVRRQAPLFDELPLFHPDGSPVLVDVPAQPARFDDQGRAVSPATDATQRHATHRAPRMTTRHVLAGKLVEVDDPKTHYGFLAPDFAAAFGALGIDFGGHVTGDNGIEGLAPHQQIPILWKAMQELAAMVMALRAGR